MFYVKMYPNLKSRNGRTLYAVSNLDEAYEKMGEVESQYDIESGRVVRIVDEGGWLRGGPEFR